MISSTLYTCSLCKKEFQFDNIRYGDDGKRIVCLNCYKESMKTQTQDDNFKRTAVSKVIDTDTLKLICMDCRYKFSFKKKARSNLRCPYCSGTHLMKDEITASKLLEEV